jgi:hypothetical protein
MRTAALSSKIETSGARAQAQPVPGEFSPILSYLAGKGPYNLPPSPGASKTKLCHNSPTQSCQAGRDTPRGIEFASSKVEIEQCLTLSVSIDTAPLRS